MRYFLITYLRKANGQVDEQVEVTRNIKPRDQQICNVILDFKEEKVIKCVIEGQVIPKGWIELSTYFKQVYPAVIERLEIEAKQE
jgi:hypothetical protein